MIEYEIFFFEIIETDDLPHNQPQTESAVVVITKPVAGNASSTVGPGIFSEKYLICKIKKKTSLTCNWVPFLAGCSDCSVCRCEEIVEQPLPCETCNKPCKPCTKPCKNCNEECCEDASSGPFEIITTVEIVEVCGVNDQVIQVIASDEPQFIKTNHTSTSTYKISESDLAKQNHEIEAFRMEILSDRKGSFCGNGGGFFGMRGDEEQLHSDETSRNISSNASNDADVDVIGRAKGGSQIAGFANHNNNRPTKQCQIVSGWACRKFGRYPHPANCQKVYCTFYRLVFW